LPAAAVGDGGLEDAIDVEQELARRDVVDADQVVPPPVEGALVAPSWKAVAALLSESETREGELPGIAASCK